MIVVNLQLQAIGCDICREVMELRRRTTEAPELLAMVREEWEREHKPCAEFPDNPERAQAERKYCSGMRKAFEKPSVVRPVFARCRRTR